jgi:hypothetical protein
MTVAWLLDEPCYALEGFVMAAGAVLDWLAERLAVVEGTRGVVEQATRASSAGGVLLVPALQGLASPWWRPDARAALLGMTRATSTGDICHAGLESVCYQVRAVLEAMRSGTEWQIPALRVDGRPSRSDYLMQLQADILQLPLIRSRSDSLTGYGSALMAGLGCGIWGGLEELAGLPRPFTRIEPNPASARRWETAYRDWRAATERCSRCLGSGRSREMTAEPGKEFDLMVIGGGINGAPIAYDAAGRGLSVALAEMRDFAEGTSSRSSKLIHGGLRYLETYDFKLVRDALLEREILMAKAPHLVWPLRLVLPHVPGLRPRWMIHLGLFLYDHLAPRKQLPASEAIDFRRHPTGAALKPEFRYGFAYSDCRGDDSRLVIANLLGAQRHGARSFRGTASSPPVAKAACGSSNWRNTRPVSAWSCARAPSSTRPGRG